MVLGVSASGGGEAEVKKEAAGSEERRRSKWKKMEGGEVNITLGEEGGSINWTDELDEEIPPWEKEDVKIPTWNDNAYWSRCEVKQFKPAEQAAKVRKVAKVKKTVKVKRVVHIKKETTHPHLMPLGSYLAMQLGEEGMKKLRKEKGVRTEKQLEERYSEEILREAGVCQNPGTMVSRKFDVEKMEPAAQWTLIRKYQAGPKIITVDKGGRSELFVVLHAMCPRDPLITTPVTFKEQQAKQDTGSGQLRGVEAEVMNH